MSTQVTRTLRISCGHCGKEISTAEIPAEQAAAKIDHFRGVRLQCPHCHALRGPKTEFLDEGAAAAPAPAPEPEPEPAGDPELNDGTTLSYEDMTVAQLRDHCEAAGLSKGGTKAELVARLSGEADVGDE